MAGFKRIISLGNGCEANFFTWCLGLKKDSPLDNSAFDVGPIGLRYILNGEFKQRILSGDIISSKEGEESDIVENWENVYYPIVPLSDNNFIYFPHITPSKFKTKILSRIETFEQDLKDESSLFLLTDNDLWHKKASDEDVISLMSEFGNIINPQKLIILSQNTDRENISWLKFGFSVISTTHFKKEYKDEAQFKASFFSCKLNFTEAFRKYLIDYPEMAQRLRAD